MVVGAKLVIIARLVRLRWYHVRLESVAQLRVLQPPTKTAQLVNSVLAEHLVQVTIAQRVTIVNKTLASQSCALLVLSQTPKTWLNFQTAHFAQRVTTALTMVWRRLTQSITNASQATSVKLAASIQELSFVLKATSALTPVQHSGISNRAETMLLVSTKMRLAV